jgi:hypothetical protein
MKVVTIKMVETSNVNVDNTKEIEIFGEKKGCQD